MIAAGWIWVGALAAAALRRWGCPECGCGELYMFRRAGWQYIRCVNCKMVFDGFEELLEQRAVKRSA